MSTPPAVTGQCYYPPEGWLAESVLTTGSGRPGPEPACFSARLRATHMSKVDRSPKTRNWDAIIQRAQRMDASAFDEIVDAYAGRLCGFFLRLLGQRDDAEDLTQEVFVRLVRGIGSYSEKGRFDAWLFRIAANLARDRVRREQRSPGTVGYDADDETGERFAETGPDGRADCHRPERAVEAAEEARQLEKAIARLPEMEREVVLLRHYGQLSFAEIAQYMDTPIGTALARAHRGLGKLRDWMEAPS